MGDEEEEIRLLIDIAKEKEIGEIKQRLDKIEERLGLIGAPKDYEEYVLEKRDLSQKDITLLQIKDLDLLFRHYKKWKNTNVFRDILDKVTNLKDGLKIIDFLYHMKVDHELGILLYDLYESVKCSYYQQDYFHLYDYHVVFMYCGEVYFNGVFMNDDPDEDLVNEIFKQFMKNRRIWSQIEKKRGTTVSPILKRKTESMDEDIIPPFLGS